MIVDTVFAPYFIVVSSFFTFGRWTLHSAFFSLSLIFLNLISFAVAYLEFDKCNVFHRVCAHCILYGSISKHKTNLMNFSHSSTTGEITQSTMKNPSWNSMVSYLFVLSNAFFCSHWEGEWNKLPQCQWRISKRCRKKLKTKKNKNNKWNNSKNFNGNRFSYVFCFFIDFLHFVSFHLCFHNYSDARKN